MGHLSKASSERSSENALLRDLTGKLKNATFTGATLERPLINADLRESMLDKINAFETSFKMPSSGTPTYLANVSGADFSMAHCTFTNLTTSKTENNGPRRHARNKKTDVTDWNEA